MIHRAILDPSREKNLFCRDLRDAFPKTGRTASRLSAGVIDLPMIRRQFWRAFSLMAMLFLGAGLTACMPVARAPEPEEGALVTFVFIGQHDSVCLSGDFNGWSLESHCLQRKGDEWSIQLDLSPGVYRYGFVINGKDWVCDPEAPMTEDDGFGKKNSVFVIAPSVTKRPPAP
ncbi:MAG: isoamylase early set domain-containing protein [Desulfobacterota bacterium]|jgi:hypothetical protein|nr:isoamylase early set domain-containing protein [Thermodesulfobacteriota bacterium]